MSWLSWFPDDLSSGEMYLPLCPYCVIGGTVFWDLWSSYPLPFQQAVLASSRNLHLNKVLHRNWQSRPFLMWHSLVHLLLFVLFGLLIIIWDYGPFHSSHCFEYSAYLKFGCGSFFKDVQAFLEQLIHFFELPQPHHALSLPYTWDLLFH